MHIDSVAALAAMAPNAHGVLRFGCSQIAIERLDPLVAPGSNPSPHVHQIVGGNAFNATMPHEDVSSLADCTSCTFDEDLSNYWTANMYFRARNGTFKRVPQIPNRFLKQANGGMTVYYRPPYDGRTKVTAFKPGFRMLAGDVSARTEADMPQGHKICFRCFNTTNFGGDVYAPCSDPNVDSIGFPQKKCPGGIRTNVHFPTCWDGVNVDSDNHQSHMSYPESGSFESGGPCPASHPVKTPQVMLEVVWDTAAFADEWTEDEPQPFYLSYGDSTGFGQHADYVFGWKGDALQDAMDAGCIGDQCAVLSRQSFDDANECVVPNAVEEEVDGWLDTLPGYDMGGMKV